MRIISYILLFVSAGILMSCEKPDTVIEDNDPKYAGVMTVRYEISRYRLVSARIPHPWTSSC